MAKKILITVIVLEAFQDKYDHKTQYPVGAELQVDKERADDLVSRGLAKIKEEVAPKEPKTPKEAKAPKTPKTAEGQEAVDESKGTEEQ